ncbi:retrotransposon protein, putative, ty1-copia subclass [Tanacetum coccineum]
MRKNKKFGFAQNLDEPCVYQKASGSNVTFLILYVDDIILMGNHIPRLQSVKSYLGKCFAMKDLREEAFILGIKIYRDRSKRLIGVSQCAYKDKILKRFKMENSKCGNIPMQEGFDLNKTQGASTHGENLGELHWTVVKIILKYIRNTKDMFLVYGGNPKAELRVDCYCDAGFKTDRDDIKTQTRYVFILNGGAVDWKSSKQSTTAISATEFEYIAASEAAMEAVWIRKFILGLCIVPTINEPIKMFCDNSALLLIANEPRMDHTFDSSGFAYKMYAYAYIQERCSFIAKSCKNPTVKEHPTKDDACHHCKEVGHYKRNCPAYLDELIKKKKQVGTASSSGILVFKNDVLYFNAIPSNGIYEIDMLNLVLNVNFIYNVSNKRAKHNLDSTYLWHFHLAHISKKRIEKLQHDGLLKLTDEESFDKCVSCLSGKMTRKPFPHQIERATALYGLIHTDVRDLLRHVLRQGASYFITFMDDYSPYGYAYLLKHKHEVFETFKVFKNEVENQLGKTIEVLRSDQGVEYISQEFKDYLKACGIVQQLTHPYTRQHNRVYERRNRTLLDMVRSMMNLTTLLLSFWDYALKSATLILNMVPAKKVDKTPYELWIPKGNNRYLKSSSCSKGIYLNLWVDYEETFSPVADIRAIRILIAITVFYEYEIWKMDFKTAFLNGYLDEDFYVCCAMKDRFGEAAFVIGIKIYRDRSKQLIGLIQSAYMDEILKRFKMENSKRGNIPMQKRFDLNKTQVASTHGEVKRMKNVPYASAVESIINIKDMFLVYGGNPEVELRVVCYCDAGFETNRDDIKSQTGYVFILNGGAVDWKSSKQSTTTMSAIEFEYIDASEAAMEAV